MKIPSFCTLVKKPNDLLTKVHTDGLQFKLKTKTDQGLTVETKATQQQKSNQEAVFSGNAKLTYQQTGLKLTEDFSSAGTITASAIYNKVKNTKAKAKVTLLQDKSLSGILSFRFKNDLLTSKLAVTQKQDLKACVAAGKDGFGAGLQVAFNLQDQKFSQMNAALFWLQKHSKLVLKHQSQDFQLGEFQLYYYQKLSPVTKVATSLFYPWTSNPVLCFGGEYKWHKNTKLNAAVTSKGKVTASLKQDINPNFNLTVSADIDATKVVGTKGPDAAKLGFIVSFQ